jgi:hypothetical protein
MRSHDKHIDLMLRRQDKVYLPIPARSLDMKLDI